MVFWELTTAHSQGQKCYTECNNFLPIVRKLGHLFLPLKYNEKENAAMSTWSFPQLSIPCLLGMVFLQWVFLPGRKLL